MKKSKQQVLEFSPGRDGNGMMDEFARQMNGIAHGLAARSRDRDRPRRPAAAERSRPRNGS